MTTGEADVLDARIEQRFAEFEAKLLKAVGRAIYGVLGLLIAGVIAFAVLRTQVGEHDRRIADIEQVGSAPVRVAISGMQATLNANAETLRQMQQDLAELRRATR